MMIKLFLQICLHLYGTAVELLLFTFNINFLACGIVVAGAKIKYNNNNNFPVSFILATATNW